MQSQILESLQPIMHFINYFGAAILLLIVFSFLYSWVTPYNELKLIREGKIAPAMSFGGAIIGFVLPLHSAIIHSVGFIDMIIWATIALLVQVIVFLVFKILFKDLIQQVAKGQLSSGITIGMFSIAVGIVNAASMS